ncbi:MAG: methylated-DNA--[protein]-cysteine S-methyltransferase [Candidatus Symbiothrix sp.]|jgi:methylated-DNA-[protein]-cysteine S-methyltransferase|nr:methylated-DNA--[protein]-cysteine S-methyltransferase [Candidatus Symbiothrix sp.]
MKHYYQSFVGTLEITAGEEAVTGIRFIKNHQTGENAREVAASPVMQETCKQLDEYFAGKRRAFDLPLAPSGTDFQQKVWRQLQQIPYGKTISYAQLADATGNPKACRAVGSANGKNPLAIVIPCHRVIASDGGLGGYAYGLAVKKDLLELETG